MEWEIRDNLSLLLEYDPATELPADRGGISSHYNYGIHWQPWQWLTCGYSYQGGDRHSFLVSITHPFGKTLAAQKQDEPFYGPVDWTPLRETLTTDSLYDRLRTVRNYLVEEGFKDARVAISDDMKTLYIEFENKQYLSYRKAIGRVLRIAAAQTPSDVENICVTLKRQDIAMAEFMVARADYIDYLNDMISEGEILSKAKIGTEISEKSIWWDPRNEIAQEKQPSFTCVFEPVKIDTFLNDPSGFFRFRAGPAVLLRQDISKGTSVESYIKFPFYSDIKTNQGPISDSPVRSDIYEYLSGTGISVETLFVNRFFKLGSDNYVKLGGGYLELQYAGITAEYLKTFKQGRFALGQEITWAKRRDADSVLGLQDVSPVFIRFLNLYAYAPGLDTTFSAKIGTFLAGDTGVRMQVTRDIRGGKVFIWYTRTDTSDFTGANKDYCDKGIGFAIPIRIFKDRDCRGYYSMSLSPWARDTGQSVNQPYSLFDFVREFTPAYIFNHWEEAKE